MSKQIDNFKQLVKGNNIDTIVRAIDMLQPKAKKELMEEYKVDNTQDLAKLLK